MASAGIYPRDNWALIHCTVTWPWLPKRGALVSSITLIKQEFCVVNDVLIYLRYLHGYNASPDAHLSNTLITFNRPTVCNIAHKKILIFFSASFEKKITTVFYRLTSHESRESWSWVWASLCKCCLSLCPNLSPTFSFLSRTQWNIKVRLFHRLIYFWVNVFMKNTREIPLHVLNSWWHLSLPDFCI